MQCRNLVINYQVNQVVAFAMTTRSGDDQLCSGKQWPKKLPDRDVKAERRLLQYPIGCVKLVFLLHPKQTVRNPTVCVHCPLRLARGTRGVDHVCSIIQSNAADRVCTFFVGEFGVVTIDKQYKSIRWGQLSGKMFLREDDRYA